jgi:hypothetical protein
VLLMYALLRALPKTSALIMVGDVDQRLWAHVGWGVRRGRRGHVSWLTRRV